MRPGNVCRDHGRPLDLEILALGAQRRLLDFEGALHGGEFRAKGSCHPRASIECTAPSADCVEEFVDRRPVDDKLDQPSRPEHHRIAQ